MIDKGLDENASAAEEFGAFIGQFGSGLSINGRGFKAGLLLGKVVKGKQRDELDSFL